MKYSNAKTIERIGVVQGNLADKEIPIYRVDFFSHYRVMVKFYDFIDGTTGWESNQGSYTKAWKKIPSLHRLGDEEDNHSSNSYIDYLATAIITFDTKTRRETQQWWLLILDRYLNALNPRFQDCSENVTWVTISGALSLLGYVPSVVYGGDLRRGDRIGYQTIGNLRKECRKLTQSLIVHDSALNSRKGFHNEIFLFNEDMKIYLMVECPKLINNHNLTSRLKG